MACYVIQSLKISRVANHQGYQEGRIAVAWEVLENIKHYYTYIVSTTAFKWKALVQNELDITIPGLFIYFGRIK